MTWASQYLILAGEGVHSDTVVKRLIEFVPGEGDEGLDRSATRLLRDAPAA